MGDLKDLMGIAALGAGLVLFIFFWVVILISANEVSEIKAKEIRRWNKYKGD